MLKASLHQKELNVVATDEERLSLKTAVFFKNL